jgi:hypothetical protein
MQSMKNQSLLVAKNLSEGCVTWPLKSDQVVISFGMLKMGVINALFKLTSASLFRKRFTRSSPSFKLTAIMSGVQPDPSFNDQPRCHRMQLQSWTCLNVRIKIFPGGKELCDIQMSVRRCPVNWASFIVILLDGKLRICLSIK